MMQLFDCHFCEQHTRLSQIHLIRQFYRNKIIDLLCCVLLLLLYVSASNKWTQTTLILTKYTQSKGARGSVGGWGTMLQAGMSRDRVPMRWIFFQLTYPSSRTMAQGSTQPLTEMSTRNLPGSKGRPARRADNLTAICELIRCFLLII
jgi:hypothetical protein